VPAGFRLPLHIVFLLYCATDDNMCVCDDKHNHHVAMRCDQYSYKLIKQSTYNRWALPRADLINTNGTHYIKGVTYYYYFFQSLLKQCHDVDSTLFYVVCQLGNVIIINPLSPGIYLASFNHPHFSKYIWVYCSMNEWHTHNIWRLVSFLQVFFEYLLVNNIPKCICRGNGRELFFQYWKG
jgi:hypothetical protein